MRHIAIAIALLTTSVHATRRSTVWVGDLSPQDSRELERFCDRYDALEGDLVIGPSWTWSNLAPVSCIQRLSGDLRVEGAPLLTSLEGLTGLAENGGQVIGHVVIRDNPTLRDLDGLGDVPGLRIQSLVVRDNPALVRVDHMPNLVPGGTVRIQHNPQLRTLTGPSAAPGTHARAIELTDNAALETVDGFHGVTEVDTFRITGSPSLQRISGPQLRRVGTLALDGAMGVEDLEFLSRLQVAASWTLDHMPRLTRLPDLPNLAHVGHLTIQRCASLSDVGGMLTDRNAPAVVTEARIEDNPLLPEDHIGRVFARLGTTQKPGALVILRNAPPGDDVHRGPTDGGGP
jgi:hypothetical protein